MKNCWVISPNVLNQRNLLDHFLNRIRNGRMAMMGWDESNRGGKMFARMAIDDLVIIARGANWQKEVYFAGYVASDVWTDNSEEQPIQCRDLRNFADISNVDVPFNDECSQGAKSMIPAIYRLDPGHAPDARVMETVVTYLQSREQEQQMELCAELLFANRQLILTGAPGTGKTYTAKKLVDQYTDGDPVRQAFIQFHPTFDYTDFVEGLKPVSGRSDGQIGFELRNGIFKEFCRRAGLPERLEAAQKEWNEENLQAFLDEDPEGQEFWRNWAKNWSDKNNLAQRPALPTFFLILDEINRAELSRVFGELFFAMEPEYRGPTGKVKTQYSGLNNSRTFFTSLNNDRFFVPTNLYLIGTMNDIDRSVESFDFALRRRFAWLETLADEALFHSIVGDLKVSLGEAYAEALRRYTALNLAIVDREIGGLSRAYQIGPAYFRKLGIYAQQKNKWDLLWRNHLELLLSEYLRGMPTADQRLGELKSAYDAPSRAETVQPLG